MEKQEAPNKTPKRCISGSTVRSYSQKSKAVSKLSPPKYYTPSQKLHYTAIES